MEQINWGIIGCGDVTEIKSGPAFSNVSGSALVAVMRRDGDKAADYARRHNVAAWYTDADALIHDPDVNAVYVATPPASHAEYAIRAMRAGKPVYVEKPMALNAVECAAMNHASHETGMPLFVAYYRRALPYFLKIKELVNTGVIGDIRHVDVRLNWPPADRELGRSAEANWRVTPTLSGGGLFHDLASHQFDFLECLLGPIHLAQGFARNQAGLYEADDMVAASFAFESGVVGTGIWCFTVNPEQRLEHTQLVGSAVTLTFSFFENFIITITTATGTETLSVPFPDHVQEPLIASVVAALQGRGTCPSTGETALRASLILDWITAKN